MPRRLPSNWKSRLELHKEYPDEDCDPTYTLRFAKGKTPRGFFSQFGEFIVENRFIHSDIDKHFQNRGLGFLCYRTILHDLGMLKTSYHRSTAQAQEVWKKLVKIYPHKIDFWVPQITIWAVGDFKGLPILNTTMTR